MGCPEIQENFHILECPKLNESGQELNFEDILNGSIPIPKAIQGDQLQTYKILVKIK